MTALKTVEGIKVLREFESHPVRKEILNNVYHREIVQRLERTAYTREASDICVI